MLFTPQRKQGLKRIVLLILSLYVMLGASLYLIQEKILFRPTVLPKDHVFHFDSEFEEVFVTTKDSAILNGLHFRCERPKGVIIYFHGNVGDLSRWGKITEYFVRLNYDVLVMDYRTYGKSTGKLSEKALYDDALSWFMYLNNRKEYKNIVLYGRSLGTGIATKLATEVEVNQLILETPYFSIADVARERFPIFPIESLLKYKIPTYQFIKEVGCPITIIHGTDDKVVPFSSAEKLKDVVPLNFVAVEGGRHNDLVNFKAYETAILEILNK